MLKKLLGLEEKEKKAKAPEVASALDKTKASLDAKAAKQKAAEQKRTAKEKKEEESRPCRCWG